MSTDTNIFLEHYGVMGMHWGQRKTERDTSKSGDLGKKILIGVAVVAGLVAVGGIANSVRLSTINKRMFGVLTNMNANRRNQEAGAKLVSDILRKKGDTKHADLLYDLVGDVSQNVSKKNLKDAAKEFDYVRKFSKSSNVRTVKERIKGVDTSRTDIPKSLRDSFKSRTFDTKYQELLKESGIDPLRTYRTLN